MSIAFTDHAIHQMKERGISKESIIEASRRADAVIIQENNRRQAVKLFTAGKKHYCLVVIYEQKRFSKKIITAFITSKIRKYFHR